jgi:GT2 family glycosyltransferase
MVSFYRRYIDSAKFIICEDGEKPVVPEIIELTDRDVYTFTRSGTQWNKCEGYNKCIKLAKTNIIVLNDVDAIIKPDQILETANILQNDDQCGLVYPFNGLFLCTDATLKQEFIKQECDYDVLDGKFPDELAEYDGNVSPDLELYHLHVNKTYNGVLVGHVHSKGGCVMGRRDVLIKCNGYNPNFIGWGYEDDEMPARVNILGYGVGRLPGKRKPCWHLHHFDGTGSPKETQPFYEHNRQICSFVENSNKEDLQNYIKNWRL